MKKLFYTCIDSEKGRIILAGNSDAIHSLLFTQTHEDASLIALIEKRLSCQLEENAKPLEAFLSEPFNPKHPLAIHGTQFQKRVWKALQEIAPGTTLSYQQVASSIGAPRSSRAVGSACARNLIAYHIPCHRVIQSNGSLGAFFSGREKKEELLSQEN